ncbi:MAG: type II secretion system protein, partial [Janthinobacterium sp.]
DPVTGRAEWGLLFQPGSHGIIGVHSLSQAAPLKVGNFEARFTGFEGKAHFSEWQFMMPTQLAPPAAAAADPGPAGAPGTDGTPAAPDVPSPPLFSRPISPTQETEPAPVPDEVELPAPPAE